MIHPQITGADARVSRVVCPLCHGGPAVPITGSRWSLPDQTECPACENWGTVDADDLEDIRARYGEPLDGAA